MKTTTDKMLFKGICYALLIFSLASCYPKGPEFYEDLDLTITDYDEDYDFGAQHFYYLEDSVGIDTNIEDFDETVLEEFIDDLLDQIESNLENRGYVRIDSSEIENANFVVGVNIVASQNTGAGWVPGPPWYPWYPPGWWGPGWGGYYPPYWGGGYYAYSYTTGSVFINWWDPQLAAVQTEDSQPLHWMALFNGLLSENSGNNEARIRSSINQAFIQSPYIQSNN
mgnify:CR=1 FL=1